MWILLKYADDMPQLRIKGMLWLCRRCSHSCLPFGYFLGSTLGNIINIGDNTKKYKHRNHVTVASLKLQRQPRAKKNVAFKWQFFPRPRSPWRMRRLCRRWARWRNPSDSLGKSPPERRRTKGCWALTKPWWNMVDMPWLWSAWSQNGYGDSDHQKMMVEQNYWCYAKTGTLCTLPK